MSRFDLTSEMFGEHIVDDLQSNVFKCYNSTCQLYLKAIEQKHRALKKVSKIWESINKDLNSSQGKVWLNEACMLNYA